MRTSSRPSLVAAALAFVLVAAGPAAAQTQSTGAAVASPGPGALRPGDAIRLRIWREPDLSGDFPVDERWIATLPKVGPVDVRDVSVDSLRARVIREYSRFLNNPSIEVVPLRRVAVLGAVRAPGLYPVDPTMRVSDVLALAGGAAGDGRQDRVELRRDGERIEADLALTATIADSPIRSGDQLYVPQRGWLARNTWFVSGLIGAATALTVALTR